MRISRSRRPRHRPPPYRLQVMPASGAEEYDYEFGAAVSQPEEDKEALVLLEKAYAKNPAQVRYALGLSQALFIEGQYQRSKTSRPVEGREATELILYFHGKSAHSLGQVDEAIVDYTDYLSRSG